MKIFAILHALSVLLFSRPLVAANDAPAPDELSLFIADNAQALPNLGDTAPPDEEWLQISPYGEFPHRVGKQIVSRTEADHMATAFNSLMHQAGNLFRGVPVYIEHPDVQPELYKERRRIGKVKEVEARVDGFYGLIAWNDLGKQNRKEGYFVFPSPVWEFPKAGLPNIHPNKLRSIGMTNTPNIAAVAPWTANSLTQPGPGQTQTQTQMKLEDILKGLGLAANATDEQINAALQGIASNATALDEAKTEKTKIEGDLVAANAKVATAQAKVDAIQGQLTAANAAHAKTQLDAAIEDGRITAAERPAHESAFADNFETAANALASLTPKLNTTEVELGGNRKSIATAEERMTVINSAVAEYQSTHPGTDFETAWNAVESDPKFAAVFAAMEPKKA